MNFKNNTHEYLNLFETRAKNAELVIENSLKEQKNNFRHKLKEKKSENARVYIYCNKIFRNLYKK
jgi:hypothetical protein